VTSQQQDCQQLYTLHVDRVHVERDLELLKHSISFDKFDDIQAVETSLRNAQVGLTAVCTGHVILCMEM